MLSGKESGYHQNITFCPIVLSIASLDFNASVNDRDYVQSLEIPGMSEVVVCPKRKDIGSL